MPKLAWSDVSRLRQSSVVCPRGHSHRCRAGTSLAWILLIFLFWPATAPAQNSKVRISELMAINNGPLKDEDNAYSDWIEIHNGGTNTVNLGGWYLTGSAANLTKWQFPSTNLGPNQFLVVFASDKDRRVPGAPLHTNFKLGGSGEYLALVMPDGVTKASEFAPSFPPQHANISYGYMMTGIVTTLVSSDASARALVPAADIGTGWRLAAFNDSSWKPGVLGAGYDTSGNYASAIGLDLQTSMLNVNPSAYLRLPFGGVSSANYNSLTMRLRYDDGFVAYLNGTKVASRNAPASPLWNSSANASHGAPAPGSLVENFQGAGTNYTSSQFGEGTLPSVQAADGGSTGKFLSLLYDNVGGACNAVTFRQTAPGLFQTIDSSFDFRVTDSVNNPADGFSFLLIPTSLYGTNGAGLNPTVGSAAEEPSYPGVFAVGFDLYPHNERNDVSLHWNGSEVVNVTMPTSALDLAAGVFHKVRINLQYVTGGARVTVTFTPDINGAPGPDYSPITNFYVAGLSPFDCRAQFAGRTGGLDLGLDLDNVNIQFLPPAGPIAYEDFDLTPYLNLLNPTTNVLAIQGVNLSKTNANFLIQPELSARHLDLASSPSYLYPPTPGAWNAGAATLTVPEVTFYPLPGVWASNTLSIALACSSSSAIIHYTLDGSTPTTNSPVYSDNILLSANATIRAQATLGDFVGEVASGSYMLLDSTLTDFTSNLPLVVVDTQGQAIPDGAKVPAYAVFVGTNTPTGRTSLRSPSQYTGRLGIGLHGFSSLGFPKQPFTIELQDESGKDLHHELLGMPAHSDWLLYPSYNDKTMINNVLSEECFEAMGHYAIRRRYIELFLHRGSGRLTTSDYYGIYILLERIRVDNNRLDLAKLRPTDNAEPYVTGGYLFEKDRPEATDVTFTTPTGQQLIILEPKANEITTQQYNYLQGYVTAFENTLYGANWRNPLTGYSAYIGVDSFVDFHWIVEFPKNIDGVRLSNHLHKDREGKIKEGPIWDWDLSWGNADYAEGGKTNGWYYPFMGEPDDMWLRKLRTDPDFYQKITDRWGVLRTTIFSPSNLLARIDRITNYLNEAKDREFSRWPRLGTYVWPNPNGAAGGWDVDYVSPTTYAGQIAELKKYVNGRFQWIDQQFLAAPTLVTNGATLMLSAPGGAVYFTLDGTDPRASGGGLSASARLYTGAVSLTNNAGIFARAFQGTAWSPPARAVYVKVMPSLRITEINYHPAAPPTNSLYSEEDFEFLEVQNTGTNVIDLAGSRIGGGISFTFAPGELVAAGNPTTNAFEGTGTAFVGTRLGQIPGPYLSNGPSGFMLGLINSGTATNRNRVAFDQSAAANYNRVITDFDFRATTSTTGSTNRPPTVQNFDTAGTPYTTAYSGDIAPAVLPADAGSSGSFLRLVASDGSESARIGFDRTATNTVGTIIATFDFRVTAPPGGTPADGFGFALLNTANYATTGSGPAFGEGPSLAGSLGIGFDVYANGATPDEPNNNHLSLHWNGAQIGNAFTPGFSMSDGKFHRAQITVVFAGNNAYVTVRLTPNINGTPGVTETVIQNVAISGVAPYESRVAFGARTGGAWASHDFDNVNVQYVSNNATLASGVSLQLLPASQFGVTGSGTTLANFTDTPLVPNTLALDLSFNPSNLVNDVSLCWNGAVSGSIALPPASLDLDSARFFHVRMQLDSADNGVLATVDLTPDSLGTPGAPVNVFSNYFVPGTRLDSSRVELAARNGGLTSRVEVDNVGARFHVLQPLLLNPGESILVVRNREAFLSRYGSGKRIAGEYSGQLDNSGDHLTLLGPLGELILDFTYEADWYPITDGPGFSLVAVDPSAPAGNWGLATNWRPSSVPFGSPGSVDAPRQVVAPIFVNEVLANPVPPDLDTIELFNPNPTNVNIGGWYLSDRFTQPKAYRIPDGTVIPPGGFVTFNETNFNVAGAAGAFALNGEADQVWLFSANSAGDLTGFYHGFDFDASDEGVSFGRFLNSQSSEHFVAQVANSLLGTNAGPLIGPVAISEIMYWPPLTGGNTNEFLEYIELQNISGVPVPLFSPSLPQRTWRLRNAVDYDFPSGIVLGPGKRLLVVGFDPTNDIAGLAAFRSAYPMTTNVALFGPWQGKLSDTDERIELRKLGQLTPSGEVPSVLAEAVHYRSMLPWAEAAAGQGSSLQRRLLNAYGNDPINWIAQGSTPGATNQLNSAPTVTITAPAQGATVLYPDAIQINATASDPDGSVSRVEFFADGIKLGDDTNAPFSLLWTNATTGAHVLTATARDNSATYGSSAPVSVIVTVPALSILPSGGGVDLAWPGSSGSYAVQMTTNLLPPVFWSAVTNVPVQAQGRWTIHLAPLTNRASFYRLETD